MGIDTYVHLRIRDRGALRAALEAHAANERQRWVDEGREAAFEELVRGGYDPIPMLRPLDGGVAIFTGLRFHDEDMPFIIRGWLHSTSPGASARSTTIHAASS